MAKLKVKTSRVSDKALEGLKKSLRRVDRGKPINEVKGSIDYFIGEVRRQFSQTFSTGEDSEYWINEVFEDHLIVREYELPREEYWLVPYTASEADGRVTCVFAPEEDWELVELAYVPSPYRHRHHHRPMLRWSSRRNRYPTQRESDPSAGSASRSASTTLCPSSKRRRAGSAVGCA